MKQACCRRRRAEAFTGWRLPLCILGALLLVVVLASCGKQKPAAENTTTSSSYHDAQGITLTSEPAQSMPGRILQKAEGMGCQENLKQLRMLIENAKSESPDGKYPASLNEISGAGKISRCPVSHQEYQYDPNTGQVKCTFQGHESN